MELQLQLLSFLILCATETVGYSVHTEGHTWALPGHSSWEDSLWLSGRMRMKEQLGSASPIFLVEIRLTLAYP